MDLFNQVLFLDHEITLDNSVESDKYHEIGVQNVAAKLTEEVDKAQPTALSRLALPYDLFLVQNDHIFALLLDKR